MIKAIRKKRNNSVYKESRMCFGVKKVLGLDMHILNGKTVNLFQSKTGDLKTGKGKVKDKLNTKLEREK